MCSSKSQAQSNGNSYQTSPNNPKHPTKSQITQSHPTQRTTIFRQTTQQIAKIDRKVQKNFGAEVTEFKNVFNGRHLISGWNIKTQSHKPTEKILSDYILCICSCLNYYLGL